MANRKGRTGAKRNGGRGGSRGGRGGSRGRGGRGGSHGGRASRQATLEQDIDMFVSNRGLSGDFIALQNRRNAAPVKLHKKLRTSKLHEINDMVDLNRGNFSNVEEMSLNSMMYDTHSTRRKKFKENSMYNEVSYTSKNRENIFNKNYRKLTIEFVKAKEIYDPSKDLMKKLLGDKFDDKKYRDENNETIVDIEANLIEQNNAEKSDDEKDDDDDDLSDMDEYEMRSGSVEVQKETTEVLDENNIDMIEISDNIQNVVEMNSEPTMEFVQLEKPTKKTEMLFVDDNDDQEFHISYYEDADEDDEDDGDDEVDGDGQLRDDDINDDYDDYDSNKDDDEVEDNLLVQNHEVKKSYKDVDGDEIQIGKFLGSMKKTKNGEQFIELPAVKTRKDKRNSEKILYVVEDDNDNMGVDEVESHVHKLLHGESGNVQKEDIEEEDDDPEFGFLEEDYVSFDVTQIKIENLRVGSDIKNEQFYVQAPYLLGSDEFQWISRYEFSSILTENGLPDHRVNAFIKSATLSLIDPRTNDTEMVFDEDELYISDSSEEEEDDADYEADEIRLNDFQIPTNKKKKRAHYDSDSESLQSDAELDEELLEGMEDLLSMHQSSKGSYVDPMDVGTRTIRAKGKKKNFRLETNTEINPEFQKFLEDKYITRKENKKQNKEEREFARRNNTYMLTKYPYMMEMEEIMNEFKEFRNDEIRETLRFPPMDFHVNMVLRSISDAFGYSSKKIGKGKKEYLEVKKPRKNKTREPDWIRIRKLSTKRNVCFRMDVELSREEKRELKRVKGGNYEIEKMNNKGRGKFSYKEGEVVGVGAKEIGANSIGRLLLEKMGWQAGDALGPENNKGITEPIRVVVKTSKRGIM